MGTEIPCGEWGTWVVNWGSLLNLEYHPPYIRKWKEGGRERRVPVFGEEDWGGICGRVVQLVWGGGVYLERRVDLCLGRRKGQYWDG